ncbi:hypothetical protein QQA44_06975 [Sneathia vaginalis]|nr:hypothetical protein [Sneathia vaginalis]MDK9582549.1 hypothetical protein [Sneathia vaginalis]
MLQKRSYRKQDEIKFSNYQLGEGWHKIKKKIIVLFCLEREMVIDGYII